MKLFVRGILFLAIASFSSQAFGQIISWTNLTADTSFDNGANWTTPAGTGTIPNSTEQVGIFPGFTTAADPSGTVILVTAGGNATITITTPNPQSIGGLLVSGNFDSTSIPITVLNLSETAGSTLTVGSQGTAIVGGTTVNFAGNLTQASGTIEIGSTNNNLDPGQTTGTGTLNLSGGTLDITHGQISIGEGTFGSLNQTGTSTVKAGSLDIGVGLGSSGTYGMMGTGNTLTLTANGEARIDNATFTQTGADSLVDLSALGAFTQLGVTAGSHAIYNLVDGTLLMNTTFVGALPGTTGTINQMGGTMTSTGVFDIGLVGGGGTGTYNLMAGTADFQDGFSVGDLAGSTMNQGTGSTLTAEGVVNIGSVTGVGTYNMMGGTATLNNGMVIGAKGEVNQTGGTLTVPTGQTLDLSAVGSIYNLSGGTLAVGSTSLVGPAGHGVMNFNGGTIQVASGGAFVDPIDTNLAAGSGTIDAVTTPGVTSVTMSGNVSGTGGITFEGDTGTTFQLTGTNTYTGATTIMSGILNLNGPDIAHSGLLNIAAPAVANMNVASGGFAYAGALGGTGALNINYTTAGDTFVALNPSGFAGHITLGADGVNPGNFQVYGGTYANITDNGTASGVTIGGASLAPLPAGATAPTSGTVTFGNVSYTGPTLINSGFTLNAGTLDPTGIVTNHGSLFALSTGSVVNTGTIGVSTSSPIGTTFTINGGLTSTGGNTLIRTSSVGTPIADSVTVTGPATIDATSRFSVTGTGNITTPLIILTSGGLTVDPAALTNISSSLLFKPTLTQVLDTIQLTAAQGTTSLFAMTPNQAAVAKSVDQAIINFNSLPLSQQAVFNPILQAFNNASLPSQIATGLEQLSPESLQYARNIAFENSNFLAQRVNGFDADIRAGYGGLDTNAISVVAPGFNSGLGRSLGSLLAYNDPAFHQAAPNGVNYYPGTSDGGEGISSSSESSSHASPGSPGWDSSSQVISDSPNPYLAHQHPSGPDVPAMSEFIGGDVILADLNQDQNANNAPSSKANYTAADATAGVSFRMTSHLAAGVLFDYNHTDATTDSNGSKTTVVSYSPGIFATYFEKGFYANGLFSFGYNQYDNSREIGLIDSTAHSNPDGYQYVGDLDAGYDFHPDKNWVVGPTLGVTYTHLDIDSFTETGAPGADLAVDSQSVDSLRSRLGGHVIFQTNTGDVLLQPNLTAMWQHEYLASGSGITSSFNDFSSSAFTIQTASPSRDSALIGCGLTATLNNSMALYLNYLADVGASDYFAQTVVGGFKARF